MVTIVLKFELQEAFSASTSRSNEFYTRLRELEDTEGSTLEHDVFYQSVLGPMGTRPDYSQHIFNLQCEGTVEDIKALAVIFGLLAEYTGELEVKFHHRPQPTEYQGLRPRSRAA